MNFEDYRRASRRSLAGLVLLAVGWVVAPASVALALSVEGGTEVGTEAPKQGAPFLEVADSVGLTVHHFNGMNGNLYFAEHMGGSVGFLDVDGDGDLDLYVGQGNSLDGTDPSKATPPPAGLSGAPGQLSDRLFLNRWMERSENLEASAGQSLLVFEEVTESSELQAEGYSMGLAVADYDNDGDVDLYITNLGPNELWRNEGDGRFVNVTRASGTGDPRWSVAASFLDYDADGFLDLFVGNYVEFRVAVHKRCASAQGNYDYCGPRAYTPEVNRLYRNQGDGTFVDVTAKAGMGEAAGATLGTVATDLNDDGRMDLYVANDQMANVMWLNQGDGTFLDEALFNGTAVDGGGLEQASMGVVAEDFDGDGRIDLFMTHLQREMNTLYLNRGDVFEDVSRESGLGEGSFQATGFGTVTLDWDLDGYLDVFVANGAVKRVDAQLKAGDSHPLREENHWFKGVGPARFERVSTEFETNHEVSRGAARGDVDNDGDQDVVIGNNSGPLKLLLNQLDPGSEDWLGIALLEGKRSSVGARVGLLTAGPEGEGAVRWQRSSTDGSYVSAHDPRVVFSLKSPAAGSNRSSEPTGLLVRWPDGDLERFAVPEKGRYTNLVRGEGSEATGPSSER